MMYVAPGNRLKSGGKKGVGLRKPLEVKVRVPQRLLKDLASSSSRFTLHPLPLFIFWLDNS